MSETVQSMPATGNELASPTIPIRSIISSSIEFSSTRKSLMVARLTAQSALMAGATKDRNNPFAKRDYATLESVLQAVSAPLCLAGLVLTQWAGELSTDGRQRQVRIYTRIEHAESSEYMQVGMQIPVVKEDAQGIGSAMTYGRRYTLKAALGIPDVDDDGAAAAGEPSELRAKRKSSAEAKRDGTDVLFNEIKDDISSAVSIEHLRHLGEMRREQIAEMPDKWRELLREEYETKMEFLKAKVAV